MGLIVFPSCLAQTYKNIYGWDANSNQRIESFLNSTIIINERKVAVFDCDGTLLGQTPYYLADEAIYQFAEIEYAHKKDSLSRAKMKIINKMLRTDNVSEAYLQLRIDFLAGLTPEVIEHIGNQCFHEKYQNKIYPELRQLLANLQAYGFEVWVLSASPELLYQEFVHKNLGIPKNRILGVKSVISHGKVTNQIIYPIPQGQGKAEAIQTFIKARPLMVCGNSRGDLEMMNESVGLKLIVNPDNEQIKKGASAGDMNGYTVKQYWIMHDGLILYCNDIPNFAHHYIAKDLHVKENKSNSKPTKISR
ncbi:HAD family hydrolase [Yeosuana aromativorans]|nr:haloacid dehalogenase-like hydrolase [Yeosuana aromativorans]